MREASPTVRTKDDQVKELLGARRLPCRLCRRPVMPDEASVPDYGDALRALHLACVTREGEP